VPWRFSEAVEPYADAVLPLLRTDPAAYSLGLTAIDTLRAGRRFSDAPMLFGWLADDGGPARGAISRTPRRRRAAPGPARPRLGDGLLWLWEGGGEPVAVALRMPPAEGVARVVCVYTPPGRRGRRYGGAVTAAACADALARDAERVVLFTDADNPAPNKVYERIGFRPVADHRVVRFGP
jgi:ribosomal protein S18 acetylase RimI-like enzyme